MLLRFILATSLTVGALPRDSAILRLEHSDTLRARAVAASDGKLAVEALELAASATGHVFRPGGAVADIDYEQRRSEAIRLAKEDGALLARIAALPDIARGAVRGAGRDRQVLMGRWSQRIAFRGGELAAIYVKATQPVRVAIGVNGRRLCDAQRDSGRVLCQWQPATTGNVLVTVSGAPGTRFELFTN